LPPQKKKGKEVASHGWPRPSFKKTRPHGQHVKKYSEGDVRSSSSRRTSRTYSF
jgi:hypothetical protein